MHLQIKTEELQNVDIREYLAQRNAQIITENTATLEEIYSFWTVTMRDQASKPADRLKASELLSKALTLERTRSEERAAAGTLNPFDSLTDEELRRLSEMDEGLEFTEISTRELENTLKGKAVRYIVNDAGEGLCLFFEGWTDNTGSNHGDAIHISPVIDAAGKPQLVVQYVPEEERPEDSETSNNGVVGE